MTSADAVTVRCRGGPTAAVAGRRGRACPGGIGPSRPLISGTRVGGANAFQRRPMALSQNQFQRISSRKRAVPASYSTPMAPLPMRVMSEYPA